MKRKFYEIFHGKDSRARAREGANVNVVCSVESKLEGAMFFQSVGKFSLTLEFKIIVKFIRS